MKNSRNFVRFAFTKKNIFWGILILLGSIGIFFICPDLLMKTTLSGSKVLFTENILLYALLILATYFLQVIEFNIPHQHRQKISWAILLLSPLLCTVLVEWINLSDLFHSSNIVKWFGNYLCYLLLFLIFYAIFRRILPAVMLGSVISVVFGIATYYTLEFRGTPVLPWDFQGISTAMDVAGGYEYVITYQMVFTAFILFLLFTLISKIQPSPKEDTKKFRLVERFVTASIALILTVALLPMDLLGNMGIAVWPWNQKASTSMTGVSAGFFGNLQFVMVEKPENYSKEVVEELYQEITAEEDSNSGEAASQEVLPTIIVVMNESFADMQTVSDGNLTLSEDNMPFLHALMASEDVISGTAFSSVFGGNTCDSEFECLTGNSMSFLPTGSKPFQQYIDTEQTSLVSTLQSNNYKTIAIHPGNVTAWSRDTTYPLLGFDEYIYNTAFATKRTLLRGLTDDASCYNEVIYQYEQHKASSDDPLFIYNVTIQNHSGYEHEDYETTIEVKGAEGKYSKAEEYLSLIKESDDDFQILYDYFSQVDEPVIVLFFGDHWPKLEEEFTELMLGINDLNNASIEDTMRQYEVPYFIWANYEMGAIDQDFSITSINYLSPLLLKAAGLDLTPFQSFLFELHETIPVITGVGIIDSLGNYYLQNEKTPYSDLLNNYAILQYNQLFDVNNKVEEIFTLS